MAKSKSDFRCGECGWTTVKWVGRCGECQAWGTLEETNAVQEIKAIRLAPTQVARPITEIERVSASHKPTGVGEFDRVLGGGLVAGAAILLSGEPGVGKSTLLLEVGAKAAKQGSKVLYVSAEESASQVRLRAERTGGLSENLYLASETDLATIMGQFEALKPELLIVDSVQTVSSSEVDGAPGMPAQVREVAANLIRLAKQSSTPLLLLNHCRSTPLLPCTLPADHSGGAQAAQRAAEPVATQAPVLHPFHRGPAAARCLPRRRCKLSGRGTGRHSRGVGAVPHRVADGTGGGGRRARTRLP